MKHRTIRAGEVLPGDMLVTRLPSGKSITRIVVSVSIDDSQLEQFTRYRLVDPESVIRIVTFSTDCGYQHFYACKYRNLIGHTALVRDGMEIVDVPQDFYKQKREFFIKLKQR